MAGFGLSPLGSAPYGLGTPLQEPVAAGVALEDDEGVAQNSRFIDPVTRRYVIDVNGRVTGMGSVQQRVQLALSTVRGSSALANLGQTITGIKDITDTFQRQVEIEVARALDRLVKEKTIAIISVTVQSFSPNGRKITIRWRDLTTGAEQQATL